MKKIMVLIICLLPLILWAEEKLSIKDALGSKLINCKIQRLMNTPDSLTNRSGIKMLLRFQNVSQHNIKISIEPGRRLVTNDSSYQNLIFTQENLITMKAGENVDYPVITYCTNFSKSSPKNNTYTIGNIAQGKLLKLAKFLGFHKITSKAAQSAIWVITDKQPIQAVLGNSKPETRLVRNYLYEVTGLPKPSRIEDPYSYPEVFLTGQLDWNMNQESKIDILVFDKSGKQIGALVKDRIFSGGKQFYTFNYLYDLLLPGESYFVKVISKGKLIKEFMVKGQEKKTNSKPIRI